MIMTGRRDWTAQTMTATQRGSNQRPSDYCITLAPAWAATVALLLQLLARSGGDGTIPPTTTDTATV